MLVPGNVVVRVESHCSENRGVWHLLQKIQRGRVVESLQAGRRNLQTDIVMSE